MTWSVRPRKQGASTRQSRSCLPTGMVSRHITMQFSRTWPSSRDSAYCAERKVRRDTEIAGVKDVLSILSGGESLTEQMSSKTFLHRHSVA